VATGRLGITNLDQNIFYECAPRYPHTQNTKNDDDRSTRTTHNGLMVLAQKTVELDGNSQKQNHLSKIEP
jgi:hypothetical protein